MDGERREGGLSLLSNDVVIAAVTFFTLVTPLMVTLSEKDVFLESEGSRKFCCGDDVSTSVSKRPQFLVFLWRLGRLGC